MNLSKRTLFFIVLAGMVLFLTGMAGYHTYIRLTGKWVVLDTEPVDPRSLFRGDYAELDYDINSVSCEKSFDHSSLVYVVLKKQDVTWEPISVHGGFPGVQIDDRAVIRGRLRNKNDSNCFIEYSSIQTYFVAEGAGEKIERYQGRGLKVEVALAENGYPVIRKLNFPN